MHQFSDLWAGLLRFACGNKTLDLCVMSETLKPFPEAGVNPSRVAVSRSRCAKGGSNLCISSAA